MTDRKPIVLEGPQLSQLHSGDRLVDPSGLPYATGEHGFGFHAGGLMSDNEMIGEVVWSRAITFAMGSNVLDTVTSDLAATASAAVRFIARDSFGLRYQAGTATFGAASKTASVNWTADLTNPAGRPIEVWSPTPADATLANVRGSINETE